MSLSTCRRVHVPEYMYPICDTHRVGWLIFIGVVLAFMYVLVVIRALAPNRICDKCGKGWSEVKVGQRCKLRCGGTYQNDKSRSRIRALGEATTDFFGGIFVIVLASGEWVLGLIGVLALVALWGLLLR